MFWKKIIVISLLCAVFALPGCKKKTLSIYNWDDYLNPDLVKKFEKQYGCAIALSIFASNEEMYEKVKGGAEYDVLVPSSYIAKRMYEDRMLKVLDHSKLPHKKNIDIAFMRRSIDSNMKYSIPYMTVFTGIAYNKKMVKDFRPSWSMFGRTDLAGKMGMVDDLREVIGAA
ncbi:MAG: spermidine/putrescine ABC transporter substrate-binding protein, partial [Spirochaetia bacterium]|nr:spermidine/putrescine ABC transporter substrate-binding protein [Spirochaetia bacterium]